MSEDGEGKEHGGNILNSTDRQMLHETWTVNRTHYCRQDLALWK